MITEALVSTKYSALLRMLDKEREIARAGNLEQLVARAGERRARMADLFAADVSLPEGFIAALKARAERNDRLIRRLTGK